MEYWEFVEQTKQMAEALLPRVPETHQHIFIAENWGGEYAYMLENMVWVVVENQVALSAGELANLRALAGDLNDGAELLADLERARVQAK